MPAQKITIELVVKMDGEPIYSIPVTRESLMEMEVNISDDDFIKGVETALDIVKNSMFKKR